MKFFKKVSNNLLSIVSFLVVFSCLTSVAIANTETETKSKTNVLFQPPPEESQPENTEGAASRQNRICPQDIVSENVKSQINLTAVVPTENYGLTVSERPTFWVYLPPTSAQQIILTLKEQGSNPHWQQSIQLTEKTGIMGVKLSDDAPPLEIGKQYQWAIILVCGNQPHPNDPVVTAKIKRVDKWQITNSSSTVATNLEQAAIYAKQGIWYDTLDILVAEKSSLNNWDDIWVNYLQSAGLGNMIHQSVVEH